MFWPFGSKACRILDPWPGIKPAPSALEGKALTTGPPGKSQTPLVLDKEIMQMLYYTVLRTLPSPPAPSRLMAEQGEQVLPNVSCSLTRTVASRLAWLTQATGQSNKIEA